MNSIRASILGLTIFALTSFAVPRPAAIDYPIFGTWRLDTVKSVMSHPVPKSEILRIAENGGIITANLDEVAANGRHIIERSRLELNGKSYRVTGAKPYGADTINADQTDAHITEATLRKNGHVVANLRAMVDPTGQLAIITVVASGSGRKHLNETTVWIRCAPESACVTNG